MQDPMLVWHGTYPETAARIISEQKLRPSGVVGLGGDCRAYAGLACYTADNMHQALRYSFPGVWLLDNAFYSVCFEAMADRSKRIQERRGEQLFRAEDIKLTALYLCVNVPIPKGTPRSSIPLPELELLPSHLTAKRGTLLHPVHLRSEPWY